MEVNVIKNVTARNVPESLTEFFKICCNGRIGLNITGNYVVLYFVQCLFMAIFKIPCLRWYNYNDQEASSFYNRLSLTR